MKKKKLFTGGAPKQCLRKKISQNFVVSLKILPFLTDFSQRLMASMAVWSVSTYAVGGVSEEPGMYAYNERVLN